MKPLYWLPLLCGVFFANPLFGQKNEVPPGEIRCGTDEFKSYMMQTGQWPASVAQNRGSNALAGVRAKRCDQVVRIPVVVHVFHLGEAVGTGTNIPATQIQAALDGVNDRWRNVIGNGVDMKVQFHLARRDPSGNATTGIVRVDGSSVAGYAANGISFQGSAGPIDTVMKNLSLWPTDRYYNIWLVHHINATGGSVAGYAYFPPVGGLFKFDGTILETPSMTYAASSLAHELGHAFNLYHTFEGDNGGSVCPPNANCATDGDEICDTPPHKVGDCGAVNPCSGSGVWDNSRLNYMSYCGALDRFTAGQRTRVTDAIDNTGRELLLESDALIPPGQSLEVSAQAIAFPGTVLSDSLFKPVVTFKNWGTSTITSLQYDITIDGALSGSFSASTSIAAGQTLDVQLAQVGVSIGMHDLEIEIKSINNAALDVFHYDNQICMTTNRLQPLAAFCHDFEANTYPSNFTNLSPGNVYIVPLAVNFTTCATTQNRGLHLDGTTSPDSIFSFMLGPIDLTGTTNPWLSFDLARAENFFCSFYADLKIDLTTNSGASYTNVYHKNDATPLNCLGQTFQPTPERLATAASLGTATLFKPSICGDWRREVLNLAAWAGQTVTLRFTAVFNTPSNSANKLGDNMYFDNFCLNNCSTADVMHIVPPASDTIYMCSGVNLPLHMDIDQPLDHAAFLWQESSSPTGPFKHKGVTSDLNYLNLVPGTYYIRAIASRLGCFDTLLYTVIIDADVNISSNPQSTTGCLGATVSFNSQITGGTPANVPQWQTSPGLAGPWSDIPGETANTLTTTPPVGTTYFRYTVSCPSLGCSSASSTGASAVIDEPITINTEPQGLEECLGGNLQLSVGATGGGTLKYQWQKATAPTGPFSNIGALVNTYTPPSSPAGLTYYWVTLASTNGYCKDTSALVEVNVLPDPSITTQPVGFSGCYGDAASVLNVGATGGVNPLLYQWQSAASAFGPWTDVSGGTSSSLTPPAVTGAQVYRAVVSSAGSGCTTVMSSNATVNLDEPLAIAAEPQDVAECLGGTQAISVNVNSAGFVFYQWQSSSSPTGPFANIPNGLSSYTPPSFTAGVTYFRVLLRSTNGFCKDTTVVVSATVAQSQTITTQPMGFTGCLGNAFTLSAGASGGIAPLQYQWQSSSNLIGPWTNESGATATAYTPPNNMAGTRYYRIIATSPGALCGTASSNAAAVTFDGSVIVAAEPQNVAQCVGGTASISATGAGTGVIQYQWQTSASPTGPFANVGNNQSNFSLNSSTPGTTYVRVIVGSPNGVCADTSVVATTTVAADPTISAQPANVSACLGSGAPLDLNVGIAGGVATDIQWQSSSNGSGGWTDVPGATNATFTPPSTSGTTYYWATVSSQASGCGGLFSTPATVTVDAPASVAVDPQDVTQCTGGTTPVTVTAASAGSINYQWQSSSSPAGPFSNVGSNQSSFPVSTGFAGTTYFRAIVSSANNLCQDTSAVAVSNVVAAQAITSQPASQSGCLGAAVNLNVGASGGVAPLNFQWQTSTAAGGPWANVSGATDANFTAPNTAGTNFYRAIASSAGTSCADAVSNAANITLDGSVGLAAEPQDVVQCVGGTQSLAATGTGTGTVVYQWQSATAANGTFSNVGANQDSHTLTTATPGTTYFRVIVSSPNALCKDTSITVSSTVLADPAIGTQPMPISACLGDAVSLNVSAAGGVSPLNIQWQGALTASGPWTNIPGATGANYAPPPVTGTTYARAIVSSAGAGCEDATSSIVSVMMDEKVSVSAEPQPITQCLGGGQTLSATGTGAGATYQWQQSTSATGPWTNTAGGTQTMLTPPDGTAGDTYFRLLVHSANGICHDTSAAALSSVVADPQITAQPQGLEACVGGNATLTSAQTGGISPTIAWQSGISTSGPWTNIAGANTSSYNPPLNNSGTTYYRMVVTSSGAGCDEVASTAAQVLLHPKVDITTLPAPINECIGGQNALSAGATGGTSLTYQWQHFSSGAWQNVAGANMANYTPPSTQNAVNQYRIIVADANPNCGADTSNAVTVTVKTDFSVQSAVVEVCNSPGGSNPTTVNFGSFVLVGDANASWRILGGVEPPGAWTAKDFTGYTAGQTLLFEATTTNAVAPCVNVKDTMSIRILDCCPSTCTNPPGQALCNSGGTTLNLSSLVCLGTAPGAWSLTAGPGVGSPAPVPGNIFDPAGLAAGTYTVTYQLSGTYPAVCATTSTEQVAVTRAPEAGTAAAPLEFCEGQGALVSLQTLLTGADAGGAWSETSPVPSAPGAFSATTGTLQADLLATGGYRFQYQVTGGAGCPDDATTVTVQINEIPRADAGEDQTLTCDDPNVVIGDAGNPTGGVYDLQWDEISHGAFIADSTASEILTTEPGTFVVRVENTATGCFAMDTVEVASSQSYISDVASDFSDPSCTGKKDGEIEILDITGGTAPFKFTLNNGNPTNNKRFRNLAPGTYTVRVSDANGCSTERSFTLIEPAELSVDLPLDTTIFCGDSLIIEAVSSDSSRIVDVWWYLNAVATPFDTVSALSLFIKPMTTTSYRVLTLDENGCTATDVVKIKVDDVLPVYAPNIFYPESNDGNHIFKLYGDDRIRIVRTFRIFDRGGELVHEETDKLINDKDFGWDGMFRSKRALPGVYAFYAELEYCDGRTKLVEGTVTLYR